MTKVPIKVIITDDDPVSLFLHKSFVIKSGLSSDPVCFAGGAETLDYLKNHSQSGTRYLILLDINMPDISGWNILNLLNGNSYPDTQVIIVSSSVNAEDFRKAKTYSQVIGYMEKPVTVAKIQDIMNCEDYKQTYSAG